MDEPILFSINLLQSLFHIFSSCRKWVSLNILIFLLHNELVRLFPFFWTLWTQRQVQRYVRQFEIGSRPGQTSYDGNSLDIWNWGQPQNKQPWYCFSIIPEYCGRNRTRWSTPRPTHPQQAEPFALCYNMPQTFYILSFLELYLSLHKLHSFIFFKFISNYHNSAALSITDINSGFAGSAFIPNFNANTSLFTSSLQFPSDANTQLE